MVTVMLPNNANDNDLYSYMELCFYFVEIAWPGVKLEFGL